MAGRGGPQRSVRAPDSLRIAAPSSGVAVWPTWLCTVSALQVISAGGGVDSADISLAAQAASGKAAAIAIQRWFMTLSPFHQHRRSSGATRIAHRFGRGTLAIIARSEEHTSELQSLMRNSYAVFCLKKKKHNNSTQINLSN